jgi:prevent-host-death family protein
VPKSLAKSTRTLSDLKTQPLNVVKLARETGRPVVITNRGKADVVLMDAAAFEKQLKLANLSRLLAQAEQDVRAGRTVPAQEFFAERRRGKKASR